MTWTFNKQGECETTFEDWKEDKRDSLAYLRSKREQIIQRLNRRIEEKLFAVKMLKEQKTDERKYAATRLLQIEKEFRIGIPQFEKEYKQALKDHIKFLQNNPDIMEGLE